MSAVGVRLSGGRVVWADAANPDVRPLDHVTVSVDGEELTGAVIVAPESLLRPVETSGRIVSVSPYTPDDDTCAELPGEDMPPLGSRMDNGMVVAVDAVNRTIAVETVDGSRMEIPFRSL